MHHIIMKLFVLVFGLLCLLQYAESEMHNEDGKEIEEDEGNNNKYKNKTAMMEKFIVGGSLTAVEQNPHVAFLLITCKMKSNKTARFACGSSIINQVILLTAAHCFRKCIEGTHIGIAAGYEHKYEGLKVNHSAANFFSNPRFIPDLFAYDIAVVRSKSRMTLGPKIKRVILVKDPPKVTLAQVAGWGMVDEKNNISTVFLKMTHQEILSHAECLKVLHRIPHGTLCAKGTHKEGTYGYPAKGDSGSGLIGKDFVIRGIVSYKNHKHTELSVYTNVSYFFNWIVAVSKMVYCKKGSLSK